MGVQSTTAGISLYVDGVLAQTTAAGNYTGWWRLGAEDFPSSTWPRKPTAQKVTARVDETIVWNRVLTVAEIKAVYRRGTNRLRMQVRSCAQAACADNPN